METESNQPDQKQAEEVTPTHRKATVASTKMPRRPRKLMFVCGVLLVLVVVGMAWSWWLFGRNNFNEDANINKNEFQAVFLTNGQVYFGKLTDLNHKYVSITDVYYLQVQSNTSLQGASSSTSPNSQVSLVKLGNELHGPEDQMYISNDQMLFWENLKPSGKVTQAIDKYQAEQ